MKRSTIDEAIDYVIEKCENEFRVPLPAFAYYTPEDWKKLGEDERELVDNMLGWDVTDFGGDFKEVGLTSFVFRNGNYKDPETYPKPYCEKILYVMDGQTLPYHYHWLKMEDIINRGGGRLAITLYMAAEDDSFSDEDVVVTIDGKKVTVPAGGQVILEPGQSITLCPKQYHSWQALPGEGDVMVFEVSRCNDDFTDNRFYEVGERIPETEEDVPAKHLCYADYKDYVTI